MVNKSREEEFEGSLIAIKEYIGAIQNKDRRKILDFCYKKPRKIFEIREYLMSSDKVVLEHLKKLEDADLVLLDKRMKERGRPVYVKSIAKTEDLLVGIGFLSEGLDKELRKMKKINS